ncbi:MAG: DMT family transporter [Spirochaetia bacterium]|nr:DMT family transporter [Spirochaetia bacterium]MBO7093482.1 DMT family transporter [Spirochaetia bacterium]MBP5739569.1 DMT family transporter [Spirochaetia bacterium]
MPKKSILYIIITALCFGTMEVALKMGENSFTPLQINFLRFLIGGLLLLPMALKELKRRQIQLTAQDWAYMTLLGVLGISFSMSFFQIGVKYLNANTAAIIISCNPVFTMLFAHFLVHDRFTINKAIVLSICLVGLMFVANPFHLAEGNTPKGFLYMLVAMISFALYSSLGNIKAQRLGGAIQTSIPFLIASVVNLFILIVLKEPIFSGITIKSCPVMLYTGFIVTGLGYFTYLGSIEMVGPSNASISFFLKPVVAVAAASLVLHEAITWNIVLGIAIILTGFCINMKKR